MTVLDRPLTANDVAAARLERAAVLLSTGHWCVGDLKESYDKSPEDDKFCAVGAVALMIQPDIYNNGEWDDGVIYELVRGTVEIEAMARVIAERIWNEEFVDVDREEFDSYEDFINDFGLDDANETVYNFNDSQEGPEPVVEVMLEAAKRLRSSV